MRRLLELVVCVGVMALCGRDVLAQQGADRQFTAPPEPRSTYEVPEPRPGIDVPPDAASYRFVLRQLSIRGSSLYMQSDLLARFQHHVGKEIGLNVVYEIAESLTRMHRDAGYLLTVVTVPAQTIVNGQVTLQITEGYLEEIDFEGAPASELRVLRQVRARLLASRPLSHQVLEREMLLLNDIPGLVAHSTLLPSATEVGASRLVVHIERQRRVELAAGMNNRGTESMGPMQVDASIAFNALIADRDQTTLRAVSTGANEELLYFAASHAQHLGSRGTTLGVRASWSMSDPPLQNALPQLSVETQSRSFGVELTHPMRRSRRGNASLRLGFTHHRGRTEFPYFGVDLTNDRISALRVGLSLDGTDSLRGINILDLEISKGLDVLDASPPGDPAASRLGGRPDFTKTTLYAARLQSLGSLGSRWSLLVAASGQYAFNNLLSAEEFSFGGEFFGRAFDASELLGDTGVATKIELRYGRSFGARHAVTAYAFGEHGWVYRRIHPLDGAIDQRESARSIGAGLRFDAFSRLTGYVEYAKPLDRIVAAEGNEDGRIFGGVRYTF